VSAERYAVAHARSRGEVEAHLPANYEAITGHDADPVGEWKNYVIVGRDVAGWALEDVIGRLAIADIRCREHGDRNDAETAACAAMN